MSYSNGRIHLSVVAGVFATLGSLLGKLSGGVDVESTVSGRTLGGKFEFFFLIDICFSQVSLLIKLILLGLMITSNTAGCTFFVKSLQGSGSSLPATVASAATNYFCSVMNLCNFIK